MLDFDSAFTALTGHPPFPWQRALYDGWFSQGKFPQSCNLPTGLGKTSVIAVWLIALANGASVPRRLVYVVNRRTVVDQTTDEVEKYKQNLTRAGITSDLALSTLRGQFADNREWSADPSRPAVVCGTVDMIGSRLLFSGYGVGFKGKPLHAGFLGQDALLVHDEAHLEPAFQDLLLTIEKEQSRCNDFRPLRVMELTATSRGGGDVFGLTAADRDHPVVRQRVTAGKAVHLHPVADAKKVVEQVIAKAKSFEGAGRAVLVFVRTVEDVLTVADKLPKDRVVTLTGTMRGRERDALVEHPIFRRFLPGGQSDEPTVYLVCTSAGEVGVNISADHLVCDASTFESMAQRFGRVNRFGRRSDSEIHVVHPPAFEDKDERYRAARERTLALLRELNGDGSPDALGRLDPGKRQAAFAPPPTILPTSDVLFDAWALTSITGKLPGRPPVEPYLHGLPTDWQPPETQVAWRDEVEKLQPKYVNDEDRSEREADDRRALAKLAERLLEDFPLKPHELLQDRMTRVRAKIDSLAESHPIAPAWVVGEDGKVFVTTLEALTRTEKRDAKTAYAIDSRYATILLPPSVGGLSEQGMMDEKSSGPVQDVSCNWYADKERTKPIRARQENNAEPPPGMRLVTTVPLPGVLDEDAAPSVWYWFARPRRADDDGSKFAREPITWQDHTDGVTHAITGMAERLFPSDGGALGQALILAAKWHDLGKMRVVWQRSIGNPEPTKWFAKSGRGWNPRDVTAYRHEFGSLLDVLDEQRAYRGELNRLPEDFQELVLHLIAAHHGWGRPHFDSDQAFEPDPERPAAAADELAAAVPRRFARLQRRYGRWGLAYLESLLRAADWAASANPSAFVSEERP